MNTKKVFYTLMLLVFCLFNAQAQINLLSNAITFRSSTTYNGETQHWGDLRLEGQNWGWLYCNRIENAGPSVLSGGVTISNGLNVVSGTKNFIQPHPTDSTKLIKYICIEAGEVLTMVRGLSKTNSGSIVLDLPEHFSMVTSEEAPLTVLLSPENSPVTLFTAKKSRKQITVKMKPDDYNVYGDANFAWQVCGVRDGYENEEIIVNADSLLSGNMCSGPISLKRAETDKKMQKLLFLQKAKNVKMRKNIDD